MGAEFDISRQTVALHLHRRDVPMRRQSIPSDCYIELLRLRRSGWTFAKLAAMYEVSERAVRTALGKAEAAELARAEVALRPSGGDLAYTGFGWGIAAAIAGVTAVVCF
ncbi:MAG: hypothetical protein LBK28_08720 [Propionibacteriaceae bacterium]|jgi:hypothetical protein|nr:hypothetical protein [Propionibacteriaceae bacterium]